MLDKAGFVAFFQEATGRVPYPWQVKLAAGDDLSGLVRVPTGLGKTAAIVLAWLWHRKMIPSNTPRRLIYCLPMRALVEQTARSIMGWVRSLGLQIDVHVLLGGNVDRGWDEYPEKEAILVGTQDMLLSRALNRGYAESRFRWPIQFGLLNTDSFWVLDEVQLMGAGLQTSLQLQAFREKLGTSLPSRSLWMSATLDSSWMKTVDFTPEKCSLLELGEDDKANEALRKRLFAEKLLVKSEQPQSKDGSYEADRLLQLSEGRGLTLGVFNTVARARLVYEALRKRKQAKELLLLHSRFRKPDREAVLTHVLEQPPEIGRILIATQVIEAGMDVSAKAMLTDCAPWSSMVQRFGRVNRYGEFHESAIEWIPPNREKKGYSTPYQTEEIEDSSALMESLDSAQPYSLPPVTGSVEPQHVLRKRDLVDLFDTTPDLAGQDLDISRFIRKCDDQSVFVFWREVTEENLQKQMMPAPEELCPAPLVDMENWRRKEERTRSWAWDHLEGRWVPCRRMYPGMSLMLDLSVGLYSVETGWTPGSRKRVTPVMVPGAPTEAVSSDGASEYGRMTIAEHTDMMVLEFLEIVNSVGIEATVDLLNAARWHDAGKAHEAFQQRFQPDGVVRTSDLGKGKFVCPEKLLIRRMLRHELASALALIAHGGSDLSAYLAIAHHGKIRLSIRSLPGEIAPDLEADGTIPRYARGVHEGDRLPGISLGGGVMMNETTLDLAMIEIGGAGRTTSWVARCSGLLHEYGPFRLAFQEALIRVADIRSSRKGGGDAS